MRPGPKFSMASISCLIVFNITVAGKSKTPRRNGDNNLEYLEEITVIETTLTTSSPATTSNATEEPIHFPYGMVCASGKLYKYPDLKFTEQCCHETGVPCKQTDHIGQPQERNCVTNDVDEWKNMRTCCRKYKKSFKKGHVEDGIDCNHRQENVTETTEMSIPTHELTTTTTTTTHKPTTSTTVRTTTTTTRKTTIKPQPITPHRHHHPITGRPQHQTLRPHVHLKTHRTTTTATPTTTTTKKPSKKQVRRLDKKLKTLKF